MMFNDIDRFFMSFLGGSGYLVLITILFILFTYFLNPLMWEEFIKYNRRRIKRFFFRRRRNRMVLKYAPASRRSSGERRREFVRRYRDR